MPPIFYKQPIPVNIKAPKGRIVPLQAPQIHLGKSLVALTAHRISSTALTNLRMALKRYLGKKNEFLVHCHATYPVTKKPDGIKMGQGKGAIKDHVARIPAGIYLVLI